VAPRALRRQIPEVGAECPSGARSVLCGGRSVMSVPTAISEMSSQIIPLKVLQICKNPAEFWPQRVFAFELRRWGNAARVARCRISAGVLARTWVIEFASLRRQDLPRLRTDPKMIQFSTGPPTRRVSDRAPIRIPRTIRTIWSASASCCTRYLDHGN